MASPPWVSAHEHHHPQLDAAIGRKVSILTTVGHYVGTLKETTDYEIRLGEDATVHVHHSMPPWHANKHACGCGGQWWICKCHIVSYLIAA